LDSKSPKNIFCQKEQDRKLFHFGILNWNKPVNYILTWTWFDTKPKCKPTTPRMRSACWHIPQPRPLSTKNWNWPEQLLQYSLKFFGMEFPRLFDATESLFSRFIWNSFFPNDVNFWKVFRPNYLWSLYSQHPRAHVLDLCVDSVAFMCKISYLLSKFSPLFYSTKGPIFTHIIGILQPVAISNHRVYLFIHTYTSVIYVVVFFGVILAE